MDKCCVAVQSEAAHVAAVDRELRSVLLTHSQTRAGVLAEIVPRSASAVVVTAACMPAVSVLFAALCAPYCAPARAALVSTMPSLAAILVGTIDFGRGA